MRQKARGRLERGPASPGDWRCQGNVMGGNTFAQNENGEREQFSNLQAIRKKGISGNKKMTLSGMLLLRVNKEPTHLSHKVNSLVT